MMGVEDDHDYSYYRGRPAPTIRRTRKPMVRTDSKPSHHRLYQEALPPLKATVKRMLATNPDMTVDEVMRRLDRFSVTVSRTTVSVLISDFRQTMRIMREAGLLK